MSHPHLALFFIPFSLPRTNEQGDAGAVTFLRLASRRGWIADRRVDAVDLGKLRVSYLAEDVTAELQEQHLLQNNSRCDVSSVQSLNSSALSASSATFYSTVSAVGVATPEGVRRRRRRRVRRKDGGNDSNVGAGGAPRNEDGRDASFDSSFRTAAADDNGTSPRGGDGSGGQSRHLMRVLAPLGLRILDAPHFQVRSFLLD